MVLTMNDLIAILSFAIACFSLGYAFGRHSNKANK